VIKTSLFLSEEFRPAAIPLFGNADSYFEKVAAPQLLPDVVSYIERLRPQDNCQYVLVNAMGAGEWWGSNTNADWFSEASLNHVPDDWSGIPLLDKLKAKRWPYGWPTFYLAHPFAHHRNKNPARAFGEVELACWHPSMKRVELVTRIDKDKCLQFGGVHAWDRIKGGGFPDVSMGTRVNFDLCSICTDWELYRVASQTFDPKKHKYVGEAILQFHKLRKAKDGVGIRGLSITRMDYCEHMRKMPNRILLDGRKVFVYNPYPRFFDISFVFIGADKTAKVMLKIAENKKKIFLPSALQAAAWGYKEDKERTGDDGRLEDGLEEEEAGQLKTSSDNVLKLAFLGKRAKQKSGEIVKDVVPSQFAGKAIPALTESEEDLPDEVTEALASSPLKNSLSSTAGLGMVLRPREFQRIILIRMGRRPLADSLDRAGTVFPSVEESTPVGMGVDKILPVLVRLLLPLLAARSALGPAIERRVVICGPSSGKVLPNTSHHSDLLHKIGAAYNGYRQELMEVVPEAADLFHSTVCVGDELQKLASVPVNKMFTPLTVAYLQDAFMDEVGNCGNTILGISQRGEGATLREHVGI